MTWTVPAVVEDALWAAARHHLPAEMIGGAGLTAAVVDRSRRYTSERERLSAPASPLADLSARAMFFSVVDAAKIHVPLAELAARGALPRRDPMRIADVGAGCGALTLGALGRLAAAGVTSLTVDLIDRDRGALAIAREAIAAVAADAGVRCAIKVHVGDVSEAAATADLIFVGSVLNELPIAARLPLVTRLLGALDAAGALIIIEPALRATTRELHVLRDEVIGAGAAHVFAPCTRRGAPCPMLADERDWCHEERVVQLPSRAARIAHQTGLRDGAMKFSYMVLRKVEGDVSGEPAGGDAYRVVSHPMHTKGKHELHVCGDDGRIKLRLLSRGRSEHNRGFERARRGDVLRVPASARAVGDVGKDDVVERIAIDDERAD